MAGVCRLQSRPLISLQTQECGRRHRDRTAPRPLAQLLAGLSPRHRLAVGPLGDHRIVGVGDAENASFDRDLVSREAIGIAAAVEALVVDSHPCPDLGRPFAVEHLLAQHRMQPDLRPFRLVERTRLLERLQRDQQLADVVQARSQPEACLHSGGEADRRADSGCDPRNCPAVACGFRSLAAKQISEVLVGWLDHARLLLDAAP